MTNPIDSSGTIELDVPSPVVSGSNRAITSGSNSAGATLSYAGSTLIVTLNSYVKAGTAISFDISDFTNDDFTTGDTFAIRTKDHAGSLIDTGSVTLNPLS